MTMEPYRDSTSPPQGRDCQFATPGEIAQAFHEAYERGAEYFGYKTRPESAVSWENVPENNKALMIATVRGVLIERRMVVKGGPLAQALDDAREALDRVRALSANDADPGFGASPDYWAGVGEAADIASEALAEYRARHPKETP
jgi:hypothetical protein